MVFDEFQEVKKLDAGDQVLAMLRDGLVFVHNKEYRFFNPFLRAWLISKGY